MALQDADVPVVVDLLSEERLAVLKSLTGSYRSAIELHQETLQLSASLMNLTATIEIALRNSVCQNLSHHFGVTNWLFQPPVPFQWRSMERGKITGALDSAKRAKYSKMTQAEKSALDALAYPNGRPDNISHLRRAKDRRRKITVSDGSVIAEITLYFWKRLYGPDYEQSLWRTTLKRTFPNKRISRADVAMQLEQIYQSRNRLAHHEPVLHKRYDDTMSSIEFVAQNLGVKSPSAETPLARLISADVVEITSKADELHAKIASFKS